MKARELVDFFGGVTATAAAMGVKPPSVSEWLANDEVPDLRQYQAEIATDGRLTADKPAHRAPVDPPDPEPEVAADILLRNGATAVVRS